MGGFAIALSARDNTNEPKTEKRLQTDVCGTPAGVLKQGTK